jgi:hypothetical protein
MGNYLRDRFQRAKEEAELEQMTKRPSKLEQRLAPYAERAGRIAGRIELQRQQLQAAKARMPQVPRVGMVAGPQPGQPQPQQPTGWGGGIFGGQQGIFKKRQQ